MASRVTSRVHTQHAGQKHELQRRIEQVVAEVEDARAQMHRACRRGIPDGQALSV